MNPRLIKFLAASVIFLNVVSPITQAKSVFDKNGKLKFNEDGKFKIVQFTDTQDGPNTDPRTIKLMNNILDKEKPDLVVLTGDNIADGKCTTREDIKKAIDNIAQPMETRNIPWAIVFGNHDTEHNIMTREEMMKLYMSYPHNISSIGPKNVDGVGNYNLLINGSKSNKPAFNVYMMDSGSYTTTGIGYYDWIKFSQIQWYRSTTEELKAKYKKTVPALMFF
ncbi:MAG: metallophosphoesterase, partial [Bacillota bacterium]|nr:metallophosphoesterase [Bacillota bacterium]